MRRNRLTKKQIRKALAHRRDFVDAMSGRDQRSNPQVIEMVTRTKGEIIALEAVLHAMNGDLVFLNILSGD
jgi:hypothetical protein